MVLTRPSPRSIKGRKSREACKFLEETTLEAFHIWRKVEKGTVLRNVSDGLQTLQRVRKELAVAQEISNRSTQLGHICRYGGHLGQGFHHFCIRLYAGGRDGMS